MHFQHIYSITDVAVDLSVLLYDADLHLCLARIFVFASSMCMLIDHFIPKQHSDTSCLVAGYPASSKIVPIYLNPVMLNTWLTEKENPRASKSKSGTVYNSAGVGSENMPSLYEVKSSSMKA